MTASYIQGYTYIPAYATFSRPLLSTQRTTTHPLPAKLHVPPTHPLPCTWSIYILQQHIRILIVGISSENVGTAHIESTITLHCYKTSWLRQIYFPIILSRSIIIYNHYYKRLFVILAFRYV